MILQGKKIGFALSADQLGENDIFREIEKMMMEGAEIFIILFDPAETSSSADYRNRFEALLQHLHAREGQGGERGAEGNNRGGNDGGSNRKERGCSGEHCSGCKDSSREALHEGSAPGRNFLDLLVIIPVPAHLLRLLAQSGAEEPCSPPLVLIPVLKGEPMPPFSCISPLMGKEGIFFVPFGPVGLKKEPKTGTLLFSSRLDLLAETCSAALDGKQLNPYLWESNCIPQ